MLLSSRANPPKPLGDFPKGSSLTIRQLLLHSPLPSPALPALLPRHGKKPPPLNTRKVLRVLCWLAIGITLYYLSSLFLSTNAKSSLASIPYLTSSGKTYEIVGDVQLPDYPTPFAVVDKRGRQRWTVYIPQQLGFPLPAADYTDICSHAEEVARHAGGHGSGHQHLHQHDSNYVDVDEAQAAGLLPHQIHLAEPGDDMSLPVCEKSLTYALDATDAGLGSTLLGLWLAYSLAEQEHRAFFIDDSLFAYGDFSTYFTPPPRPSCRPPVKTQRVPCPHQAKHLLVSAATHPWTFGSSFTSRHTPREIFHMAHNGYKALFHLQPDDASYARRRPSDLKAPSSSLLVGIHLRRGDRHPFEFTYSQGYLPPHVYRDAAESLTATSPGGSTIMLASDDPDMYAHGELASYARAQDRITLASKKTLTSATIGWEGGFFKDLFWGLGLPLEAQEQRRIGSPTPTRRKKGTGEKNGPNGKAYLKPIPDYRTHPTDEARQLREFIGRAYLLELAVLGQSDRVVCAVSSYACRILAVMMGWEKAIEKGHWKNVDGEGKFDWRALDV